MGLQRICDKCKQEILSHTSYSLVSIAAYRVKESQQLLSKKQLELCDKCFDGVALLYDAIYYTGAEEGK